MRDIGLSRMFRLTGVFLGSVLLATCLGTATAYAGHKSGMDPGTWMDDDADGIHNFHDHYYGDGISAPPSSPVPSDVPDGDDYDYEVPPSASPYGSADSASPFNSAYPEETVGMAGGINLDETGAEAEGVGLLSRLMLAVFLLTGGLFVASKISKTPVLTPLTMGASSLLGNLRTVLAAQRPSGGSGGPHARRPCGNCGHHPAADDRFCISCGKRLVL